MTATRLNSCSERLPPKGQRYALGSPGSGGLVPDILAGVPANLGNADFKVGLSNALGGAPSMLAVSLSGLPPFTQISGTFVNVDLTTALVFPTPVLGTPLPGAGYASVRYPVPASPAFSGLQLFAQWLVYDPGATGLAASSRGAILDFF